MVRSPPFHGGNAGSIPVENTFCLLEYFLYIIIMKPQIFNLITSISLFLLGSVGHWYIMYWQFKMENWIKTPWPYLIAVGCTFLWIKASHYGVMAFNGEMWSNRFIFFVTGIFIAALLYPYHFGQPFTMKTAVQLLLAFTIIIISLFWK